MDELCALNEVDVWDNFGESIELGELDEKNKLDEIGKLDELSDLGELNQFEMFDLFDILDLFDLLDIFDKRIHFFISLMNKEKQFGLSPLPKDTLLPCAASPTDAQTIMPRL